MASITSAEFQRNLGLYQDKALTEPVTITKNGRERLVLMSIDEFQRLKRRDRSVFAAEELAAEKIDAIEAVRMDERHTHLDAELKDWTP
ncbi:MAG: type II toxin-antitoxin system Phd/YefM family antitoxin [Xanthobacteraceae bacterium]|nr:type II toxin-antitoxin system Phd/YefM family antitoxin [Xanthobacteraceae bacterium]